MIQLLLFVVTAHFQVNVAKANVKLYRKVLLLLKRDPPLHKENFWCRMNIP